MKFSASEDENLDINITPLIDVVFLLLIFFMVSTTFIDENAIDINLPKTGASLSSKKDEQTIVSISSRGEIYFKGKEISLKNLKNQLVSTTAIVIKADKAASHGLVVEVLDTAKEAGVKSLNIATGMRANQTNS